MPISPFTLILDSPVGLVYAILEIFSPIGLFQNPKMDEFLTDATASGTVTRKPLKV